MPIALVQSATQVNVSASSTTTPSITLNGVTAGNCLVLVAALYDDDTDWTITSITDGGDTFAQYTADALLVGTSFHGYAIIAVAPNVSSGNKTVTVTMGGTSGGSNRYYVFGCHEFSGVHLTTPVDDSAVNQLIDVTTLDVSAGGVGFTTTEADDMLVGVAELITNDATCNFGSPASWTNRYRQNDGSTYIGMDAGTWLPGSIQTDYTAQWSHDNAAAVDSGGGVIVALKGPAVVSSNILMGQACLV